MIHSIHFRNRTPHHRAEEGLHAVHVEVDRNDGWKSLSLEREDIKQRVADFEICVGKGYKYGERWTEWILTVQEKVSVKMLFPFWGRWGPLEDCEYALGVVVEAERRRKNGVVSFSNK